jgi:hypothetical protein
MTLQKMSSVLPEEVSFAFLRIIFYWFADTPTTLWTRHTIIQPSFSSLSPYSFWPSVKTVIKCALFIKAQNTGCYFIMLKTLEVQRATEARTQIKPHQSKQLSTVMACHIHVLLLMSLHTKQTFTVSNKPLVCGMRFEFCLVWLMITPTAHLCPSL